MTPLRAVTAAFALLLGVSVRVALAAPAVGTSAPDFSLPGTAATVVHLSSLRGKVVYIAFWASWCPASQQAFAWLQGMQQRYGARGLQVVAVGVDTRREEADAFLAQFSPAFEVGFDSANRVARAYDLNAMPTDVLVGADGRVRLVHELFTPRDQATLEKAIVKALAAR